VRSKWEKFYSFYELTCVRFALLPLQPQKFFTTHIPMNPAKVNLFIAAKKIYT